MSLNKEKITTQIQWYSKALRDWETNSMVNDKSVKWLYFPA